MKSLFIDGNNIAWTAHWAHRGLASTSGTPTSVIFGSITIIRNVIDIVKPDKAYMFWDTGRAEFRKELYPDYKKGRNENMTEEEYQGFNNQVLQLKELLTNLAILNVEYKEEHIETDDMIAYATSLKVNGGSVVICSTDKDFYQLVSPSISIFNIRAKEDAKYVTCDNIEAISGYRYTNEFVMAKALTGDPSDKIKGVGKVGEVGAKKLIASVDGNKDAILTILEEQGKSEVFNRNIKLMDLKYGAEQLSENVRGYIQNIALPSCPNYSPVVVKSVMAELDMVSITTRFSEWVQPFCGLNQRKYQKV